MEEMNKISKNINEHVNQQRLQDLEIAEKPYVVYLAACLNRNLRYSHAYFTHRLSKIRGLRWETGSILPDRLQKDALSAHEQDYFHSYNNDHRVIEVVFDDSDTTTAASITLSERNPEED